MRIRCRPTLREAGSTKALAAKNTGLKVIAGL